jgi:hypothetical protein
MDDLARDQYRNALRDRSPEWIGRPRPMPSAYRRPFWPRFEDANEPTSWVVGAVVIIIFCVVAMAIAKPILQQWRPASVGVVPAALAAPVAVPVPTPASAPRFVSLEDMERRNREAAQQLADQRREAATRQRLADENAARSALDLELRREREWQSYYKRPASCDTSLPNVDSIGCANDYIRARRTFDERFLASSRR